MKAPKSLEVRPREGGGWQCIVDGVDIAAGITSLTLHMHGDGGMVSLNGVPRAVFTSDIVKMIVLGVVDHGLDDMTEAALRTLGWQPIPDTASASLDD